MNKTFTQYNVAVASCKDIFIKKMKDYGTAWRILRTSSITDQIFIKAQRIRNIEDKGTQKINEDVRSEYIGIINYSIIKDSIIGSYSEIKNSVMHHSVMGSDASLRGLSQSLNLGDSTEIDFG